MSELVFVMYICICIVWAPTHNRVNAHSVSLIALRQASNKGKGHQADGVKVKKLNPKFLNLAKLFGFSVFG